MSDFDVFLADCPARTTLGLIGDTWSAVVVVALGERPRRYTALLTRIGGISKKMLTRRCTGCKTAAWSSGPDRVSRSTD